MLSNATYFVSLCCFSGSHLSCVFFIVFVYLPFHVISYARPNLFVLTTWLSLQSPAQYLPGQEQPSTGTDFRLLLNANTSKMH